MKKIDKKNIWLLLTQLGVWAIIILAMPLATFLSTQDLHATKTSFFVVWGILHSPFVIYFINFYLFGPFLFFRRRFWWFALCNLLTILLMNSQFFMLWFHRDRIPHEITMTPNMWIGIFAGMLMFMLLNCFVGAIAIGIRHFMRIRQIKQQLKDEKAKNTEAELAWLKNQINPHFLFNTLNNISSLCQIDADAAQDAIAQLSDLLRYAMYETNKKTVPIEGEVEFMRNYIELMKLRCNEKTEVTTSFDINADELIFNCDNTNFPKDDADRSGSGIGLENTRRRLDLMYKGHYTWEQTLEDDIYHVRITLNIIH